MEPQISQIARGSRSISPDPFSPTARCRCPRAGSRHRSGERERGELSRLQPETARAFRCARSGGSLAERLIDDTALGVGSIPVATSCTVGASNAPCTALVHRTSAGELIVEFERAGELADVSIDLERFVPEIVAAGSLQSLCDEAARIFRKLTGYDRVMVYRFDDEGHGEVFSETRKPDLEAFLGNRYPASDIPQIARLLYERNRVRLLADVNYQPVPLVPRLSPITGKDLDMSLCFLRSVSPIHIQYLKNMGVAATLVVSLMVSGKLWGLISCHHYSPRFLNFELRSVCELLAEVLGTRIAALESFMRGQGELAARRLEQRMTEWIARDGDWRGALFDRSRPLLLPLGATGAALLFEGEVLTAGDVPSTDDIREIARWARPMLKQGVFATANLGALEPAFGPLAGIASGLLAVTISNQSDEMLIWFRNERVRTVTWGGDPSKAVSDADDPSELSPRRSFAQWHQIVKGTSDPWTASDVRAARLIRTSISDVVVQFRAVRILIAQDQLDQVSRQVRSSGQQVLVANARGQVIQSNAGFAEWLGAEPWSLRRLDELPRYFDDPDGARLRLEALADRKQALARRSRRRRTPWRRDSRAREGGSGFRRPRPRAGICPVARRSHRLQSGSVRPAALSREYPAQPKAIPDRWRWARGCGPAPDVFRGRERAIGCA